MADYSLFMKMLVWPNFYHTLSHIWQGLPLCSRPITSTIKNFRSCLQLNCKILISMSICMSKIIVIFPAHNLNFHWRWRWWDQIQATFQNLFYFNFFTSLKVHPSHLYRSQNQARQQRKFGYLELWIQISQSGNWNIL